MLLALPSLEEHSVTPVLSEIEITIFALCKINENAAGDHGCQRGSTQECYLLTQKGHFPASTLQLRRRARLLVQPCLGEWQDNGREPKIHCWALGTSLEHRFTFTAPAKSKRGRNKSHKKQTWCSSQMAIAPLKAIVKLFLFKSREIKTGSSVRAAVGELWLALGGIQHPSCNFFFLLHTLQSFWEDSWKTLTEGRIHWMEKIFRLRQKSSVAQWIEVNVMHMVAVESKFLKHRVWEGFLLLAFLFYTCTHRERPVFYLSEQDLEIIRTTEQWGVHTAQLPTDSCSDPWSCTLPWQFWHSFLFHRRREVVR